MKNKVLIVETNTSHYGEKDEATGLWLGESAEFVKELLNKGIEYDFVSPKGGFVPLDPRSMKYMNKATWEIYKSMDFIARGLTKTKKPSEINPNDYIGIYYTGGHGVMWDCPNNEELSRIASKIYENKGYVMSVCHGIAGLINIKDKNGDFIIKDKKITGFTKTEELLARKKNIVPFINQVETKKRGGNWSEKRFYKPYAVADQRIITGQNPFSVLEVTNLFFKEVENANNTRK